MIVEWTVQELADRAGVSARTLRHDLRIGLLTRTGSARTAIATKAPPPPHACNKSYCFVKRVSVWPPSATCWRQYWARPSPTRRMAQLTLT